MLTLVRPRDDFLLHQQVTVGKARDLRLVRYAEHLICLRELFELDADCFADAAADAGVDFVEDDGARKL